MAADKSGNEMKILDRLTASISGNAAADDERLRLFQAPARVNIIGEHTDYNGGYVLPTTTALYTWLAVTPRDDNVVEVRSENLDDGQAFSLDGLEPVTEIDWIEYIKGVAAVLDAEGLSPVGANMLIDSDIPLGAGLSSSASLELAVTAAFLAVSEQTLPAARAAELCQRAEQQFAHVQCGIMDQYTVACAEKGNAILLDCQSMDVTQVPIPESIGFIITDSGVRHRLPDGDYNNRRDECLEALSVLHKHNAGIESFRDIDHALLRDNENLLGPRLFRRCRHILTENERVLQAVTALHEDDPARLGSLINAGHQSLRDDFEISCKEVDDLVDIANSIDGVLGSRMIGGGFGGCVLSVTLAENAVQVAEEIRARYSQFTGTDTWTHVVEAAHPVREVVCR